MNPPEVRPPRPAPTRPGDPGRVNGDATRAAATPLLSSDAGFARETFAVFARSWDCVSRVVFLAPALLRPELCFELAARLPESCLEALWAFPRAFAKPGDEAASVAALVSGAVPRCAPAITGATSSKKNRVPLTIPAATPRIPRLPARPRRDQFRNTMQLPPADFKLAQSFSALSRVSAPTRTRVQTAGPRPAILLWISTGGRPCRMAGYCFWSES